MKIALIIKDGFEELEALGIVDMARRLDIRCDIVGFDKEYVISSNNVQIKTDLDFKEIDDNYDALILPGGPGAINLRDDNQVIELIQRYNNKNKVIAAICAAPIVLEKAGVIKGKRITCYPGYEKEIISAVYQEALVQVDGNVVTGKGPAATFNFAFAILETLGVDTSELKEGTQYNYLINQG